MRLIFMGTPEFSVAMLAALHQAGHDICAVYTRPPARAGRGMSENRSPVHRKADALGLPVHTPATLKADDVQQGFLDHQADLAVVVAYGLLLPDAILAAPKMGCWNIHASLLPRWRGAAPIQRAIMAGDDQSGVCIMQMDSGLDTGPVLLRKACAIDPDDTASHLHDKLMLLGQQAIVEAVAAVQADADSLIPQSQPDTGVTYAAKIDKAEARLDWSLSAAELDRHIRGLSPFPGAWFDYQGNRIKVLRAKPIAAAEAVSAQQIKAGTVVDDSPVISCGTGALCLLEIQKAGKSAMSATDFQRGQGLKIGHVLT